MRGADDERPAPWGAEWAPGEPTNIVSGSTFDRYAAHGWLDYTMPDGKRGEVNYMAIKPGDTIPRRFGSHVGTLNGNAYLFPVSKGAGPVPGAPTYYCAYFELEGEWFFFYTEHAMLAKGIAIKMHVATPVAWPFPTR
ncbi:hypothetical protein VOI32_00800 [Paraburkholderia caribensis]|uniref:Uncharacterized protein n=1 Tax=Paraburkholderia caribensis TaxID=75105 RepID=A0A9Q6RZW4_9BURK|nr:hypothetical protein [Paraburkholderia caribensis]MCO4875567.1 hypothetical protein [Paraburkholderia caribensis]PTB30514.1 hypothetical protein C9I56_01840 [Paraburkholderia caribensis]QLB62245.1 hypothetical protein A9O66_07545 [Paraburkholderia caribensis]